MPKASRPASDQIADPRSGIVTQVWRNALLAVIDAIAGPLPLRSYLKAELPDASRWPYHMVYVSNEAGGAIPAFSDGVNWRRVSDRAVVS